MRDRKSALLQDKVYAATGLSANLPSLMLPVDSNVTMRQLEGSPDAVPHPGGRDAGRAEKSSPAAHTKEGTKGGRAVVDC